jgi:hypothetical protein
MKTVLNWAALALGGIFGVALAVAWLEQIRHRSRASRRRQEVTAGVPAAAQVGAESNGARPLTGSALQLTQAAVTDRTERNATLENALQRMAEPPSQSPSASGPVWQDTMPMPRLHGEPLIETAVEVDEPIADFEKTQPVDGRTF